MLPRPPGANVIGSMWLFKHKYMSNGNLEHQKSRLVVNGWSQHIGINCDESSSHVVKPTTILVILSRHSLIIGIFINFM